jgi:hypothetical protein
VRALLGVALLLALAGSAAAAESPLFRRADGSTIVFPGVVRAWCGTERLNVFSLGRFRQSRWQLQVPRRYVRPGRVVRFSWLRRKGLVIFVYDAKTRNEASVGAEGAHGAVRFLRATCRRGGVVQIRLSGTLASEFLDGTPVRMSGSYRGRIGPRPG